MNLYKMQLLFIEIYKRTYNKMQFAKSPYGNSNTSKQITEV